MSISTRTAFVSTAAVLLLASSGCAAVTEPAVPERPLPTAEVVEEVVTDLLTAEGVPAGVVLVTDPNGDEALTEFGEVSANEPRFAEAIFAYRSITKSFVGTVILQLAEE